jgi:OOP family OmpA-OmpF porin
MTSAKASGLLGWVALAVTASTAAVAGDSGAYIGVNVGQAQARIDDLRITAALLASGFSTTSMTNDERQIGFKLYGGYQFNRHFAIEGGYFDLGEFGFVSTTVPAGTLTGKIKVKGINLDLVGLLPFTDRFSLFARGGVNYAEANDRFSGTGLVLVTNPNPSERAASYKFGLGLQYALSRSVDFRVEAERHRIGDAVGNKGDVDLFSVGLLYRFGQGKPAEAPRAATPPPPRPVAAPAPVLVVVPVVAQTEQYCSILDIQFEINQDEIQLAEKEKLAVVGTFLKKYPNTTAVIEGHTDNVGTPEHNMTLSQDRAQSVVSYLEENSGIAAARLSAVGYGDTRPIADNSTQEGKRLNRRIDALIACATDVEGLTVVPARLTMALLIEFDANKADIRPQYRDQIGRVAKYLKDNPAANATVEGHTGNLQATAALRMQMSERRAQNVVDYLVTEFGIDRSRLSAEGFGQARRFAYNTSLEGQQENRRVNVIITYPRR